LKQRVVPGVRYGEVRYSGEQLVECAAHRHSTGSRFPLFRTLVATRAYQFVFETLDPYSPVVRQILDSINISQ
jgi:hypothetical protein